VQVRPGINPIRRPPQASSAASAVAGAVPTFSRAPPRNSALRVRVTEPEHIRPRWRG
jgi:hypothetical protein